METNFRYVFPAIRGIQAGREYYTSMCPLRLIPKLFLFDEDEIVPELRAQRQLNRARVPEMSRYLSENPKNYVFSAITASIDGEVNFDEVSGEGAEEASRIGFLNIPMTARFVINDGQHRRAAIEMALRECPELGDETIAVVFFLDVGLQRCQQMFADLNRYAIRPSKSLSLLYDHRDISAQLVKELISKSEVFRGLVELEKTTLSARSGRLFTLSALYSATRDLLSDMNDEDPEKKANLALQFWEAVSASIPEWGRVSTHQLTSGEVRSDYLHTHSVVLQALARAGNALIRERPSHWKREIRKIGTIDWRRANVELWEGRALIAGRVSKSQQNIALTTNAIKNALGLSLSPEEQRIEDAFHRGN